MTLALTFPGQGSQSIGMGRDFADSFAEAKHVFEEVDDALGQKLSQIIFDGPESDLTLTANTQPAIMATSMAIFRVLEKQLGFDLQTRAQFVAGHSLGEYSALAAAGTFSLADTARLLRLRGEAMQAAVPVGKGAMAAILGLEIDAVSAIAERASSAGECEAANDNAPGQIVVSGTAQAVEQAVAYAKEAGARKAVILPVSAPFHCSLMAPAAEAMDKALSAVEMHGPAVPLIANVTAQSETDPAVIRELLVKQVTGRVRWRESVGNMRNAGVSKLLEVGTGKVLTGLARRIDREMEAMCVQSPADLDALAKWL